MRIRTLKPEFWKSQDIADLPFEFRLLFIGLWSYVDDNGVGRDVPKLVVADLFALEDDPRDTLAMVSRGLQRLAEDGLIVRYEAEGRPYLFISAWSKHQKIDRPAKGRYPLPTCGDAVIRDTLATPSREVRETLAPVPGEQGNRGTGEQGTNTPSTAEDDQLPFDGGGLLVTADAATSAKTLDEHFAELWSVYPRKVEKQEARKCWDRARKRATIRDILDGAIRYRDDPNRDPEYTKNPPTWLNRGCWDDDPLPPRRGQITAHRSEHETLDREWADNVARLGVSR